jgi:hypothetical protein
MNNTILIYILRKRSMLRPDGSYGAWNMWYTSDTERRECCEQHNPTYEDPYRLFRHCRSLRHVCALHNTDYDAARSIAKQPHWCAIEKLAQKVRFYADLQTTPPTMEALAPAFLQALRDHQRLLTPDETNALVQFLRNYLTDADMLNAATRVLTIQVR